MTNPITLWRNERQAEREHQANLLKLFLNSLETIQENSASEAKANSEALVEVARGITAQAQSFGEWIKCFQVTTPPTSSVVRDIDEYRDEQERLGMPQDMAALPPELRLAWALKNDPSNVHDVFGDE